jgi:hypothetical protein
LSYGDKPNVTYNASINTLRITFKQDGLEKNSINKLLDYTENGERILYEQGNLALQKWNNIILNFDGGTLDIFLNGELVKSNIEVIPYFTLDNLTIGNNNGYIGGICNVIYFQKTLSKNNIYYVYDMLKDKPAPTINNRIF